MTAWRSITRQCYIVVVCRAQTSTQASLWWTFGSESNCSHSGGFWSWPNLSNSNEADQRNHGNAYNGRLFSLTTICHTCVTRHRLLLPEILPSPFRADNPAFVFTLKCQSVFISYAFLIFISLIQLLFCYGHSCCRMLIQYLLKIW